MQTKLLTMLSAGRRDAIFAELRRLVTEVDAIDRSLERYGEGEGMAVDEALEEVCSLLNREGKKAKKALVLAAA